jgi:SAM-dependent methyltransferase
MKKFSELSQIDTTTIVADSIPQQQEPVSNFISDTSNTLELQDSLSDTAQPFPDYMVNDSNYVGYESQKFQYTLYRAAEFGTVMTGVETVLDVGCGRGDFGDYLLNRYPNVKYTGIDMSDLAIRIGQYKYGETYSEFRYLLQQALFDNNSITEQKFDYVFHINNLSIDYGVFPNIQSENNRYEYLKQLIQKSLDICNIGVVFTLYNESTEFDGQLQFSLTPISKILYDMNLKFAIDNTDVPEVFKLVILKSSF